MKLSGAAAAAFARAPDPAVAGILLHGADEGAVAARRRELVAALLGPEADAMRLERLDAGVIRRDPAALDGALRARGFFAGRGIVLVEGATDAAAAVIEQLLAGAAPEDALLVVTAGLLPARSALRKTFEGGRGLVALQIVTEALDAVEIDAALRRHGAAAGLTDGARALLASIAAGMDPAGFDRFLETLALYATGAEAALTGEEVAALAPSGLDAELDAFVAAVATGDAAGIGPLLRRVSSSGAAPVSLLLALQRHFRQLLLVASAGGGVEAGMGRVRPPLWGPRKDAVRAQLRAWRRDRLEVAARLLFEADGRVRSADRAPALALVERCALRLAMMVGR